MARLHLFELEDQKWFPKFLRNYMTDYLEFVTDTFDIYKNIHPVLEKGLSKTENRQIIDTGSGGGGGMVKISQRFELMKKPVEILLTDFYPNIDAFQKVSDTNPNINFFEESVDAKNIPRELKGLRTMFLAFHHFKPKDGVAILKNAVENNQPIAIFEIYQLTIKDILGPLFVPFFVWIMTPLMRPIRLWRLIFTYLIPILPFTIMFDGVVSVLRSYSPKALQQLIDEADPNGIFEWEIDSIPSGNLEVHYLLGVPKS